MQSMNTTALIGQIGSSIEFAAMKWRTPGAACASRSEMTDEASNARSRDYILESVDNALQILLMLQQADSIRLTDAAAELGVGRSTAHRLLTTLVRRGFVDQNDERRYLPGPAMRRPPSAERDLAVLRAVTRPRLAELTRQFNETTHLVVRDGPTVRFLDCVEATHPLHIRSQVGVVHPAHRSAGGHALLAELGRAEIEQIYSQITDPPAWPSLMKTLAATRARGYGMDIGLSARGISALGSAIRRSDGRAVAAVTLAAPSMRLPSNRIPQIASALRGTCENIGLSEQRWA